MTKKSFIKISSVVSMLRKKLVYSTKTCLALIGFSISLYLFYQFGPKFSTYDFSYKIDDSSILKYYYRGVKSPNGTVACRIPETPAIPNYFVHNWRPCSQDCSYEQQLAVLQNDTVNECHKHLKLLPNIPTPCCIQEITRGESDKKFGLTKCDYVESNVNIGMKEALLITCGDFINVEASIPVKPGVKEKINYWKKVRPEERPPSVLIFGVDSTSRAHAYRSLPKSIDLMMKLGFIDFPSYHSVAPLTITNFLAFLMGLKRNQVRESCMPDWNSHFDGCPLIWKKFSDQNYVTNYMEDGPQTFHWGANSGFKESPTDYYLHHLFSQLHKSRYNLFPSWWTKTKESRCTSSESVPEFILRYTTRFLQKFSDIPFFSFVWLTYPFHDDGCNLANIDRKLIKLLEMVSSNEDLLRNVVIIFLSDHGSRYGRFSSSESFEGFLERGLPPLFVRLPDRLKTEHPEIVRTLKVNSEMLTTPFDVHQTLLHILHMSSKYRPELVNYRLRTDRCSLFSVFPLNRTCSITNIPPGRCLCNIQSSQFEENREKVGEEFISQLLTFAVSRLNDKVKASKYSSNCSQWKPSGENPVIFHRIVSEKDGLVDSVLAFKVTPGGAAFEARIITPQGNEGRVDYSSMTGISRISKYGDQSWCVQSVTDEDKTMKELCYCL